MSRQFSTAPDLSPEQKSRLDGLVQTMKTDLEKLRVTHGAEAEQIAGALERVVANASKPASERKQSLLQLTAKGLQDAAELVKDTAPTILAAASSIAQFIAGL